MRQPDFPFELESEEYWDYVGWVLQEPSLRGAPYLRPMFEIEDGTTEACDFEVEKFGECMCLIN